MAFDKTFGACTAQWQRMIGAEDGTTDALLRFTRPVMGAFFRCQPTCRRWLDHRAPGL